MTPPSAQAQEIAGFYHDDRCILSTPRCLNAHCLELRESIVQAIETALAQDKAQHDVLVAELVRSHDVALADQRAETERLRDEYEITFNLAADLKARLTAAETRAAELVEALKNVCDAWDETEDARVGQRPGSVERGVTDDGLAIFYLKDDADAWKAHHRLDGLIENGIAALARAGQPRGDDGMKYTYAVYYWNDGRPRGAGVIAVSPKECAEDQHVVQCSKTDEGNGRACLCGRLVRRVLRKCPTCHSHDVAFAELAR